MTKTSSVKECPFYLTNWARRQRSVETQQFQKIAFAGGEFYPDIYTDILVFSAPDLECLKEAREHEINVSNRRECTRHERATKFPNTFPWISMSADRPFRVFHGQTLSTRQTGFSATEHTEAAYGGHGRTRKT